MLKSVKIGKKSGIEISRWRAVFEPAAENGRHSGRGNAARIPGRSGLQKWPRPVHSC